MWLIFLSPFFLVCVFCANVYLMTLNHDLVRFHFFRNSAAYVYCYVPYGSLDGSRDAYRVRWFFIE